MRKLKLEGPSKIQDGEEHLYLCSIESSSPDIILKWKINEETLEGDVNIEYDQEDNDTVTIQSELMLQHDQSDRINLVCYVEGVAREYHRQKVVKVLGVNTTKAPEEIWRIIERDNTDEEFVVPDGFITVAINEHNYRDYVSKIKNLLTEEIGKKIITKKVAFVKSIPEGGGDCGDGGQQCCPDKVHPEHGNEGYGCCASTEFGCCPDNMTPATAPFFDVSNSC